MGRIEGRGLWGSQSAAGTAGPEAEAQAQDLDVGAGWRTRGMLVHPPKALAFQLVSRMLMLSSDKGHYIPVIIISS